MIYYLKGKLCELTKQEAVIDCSGVGYRAMITAVTYEKLVSEGAFLPSGECGEIDVKLYTTVKIRDESSFEMYGFYSKSESTMFSMLQTVSGIGPKAALAILSVLSPTQVCSAIRSDDIRLISKAQGVGPKAAQKICIDLKNKIDAFVLEFGLSEKEENVSRETLVSKDVGSPFEENKALALEALVNLGYSKSQAQKALEKATGETAEDLIRTALSQLF